MPFTLHTKVWFPLILSSTHFSEAGYLTWAHIHTHTGVHINYFWSVYHFIAYTQNVSDANSTFSFCLIRLVCLVQFLLRPKFLNGSFSKGPNGREGERNGFVQVHIQFTECVWAPQSPYTSRSSGASSAWWQKTGKYLLCFHLVFALWSTQLCVYMQFVREGAICVLLMCEMHAHTH